MIDLQTVVALFDLEPSNLDYAIERHLENQLYLYVVVCDSNYGNKNVFKIGYSHDVEVHLCSQLSNDVLINSKSCKFKLSEDLVNVYKKRLKESCNGHNLRSHSKFSGKSDWYYFSALQIIASEIQKLAQKHVKQDIDIERYDRLKFQHNWRKRGPQN